MIFTNSSGGHGIIPDIVPAAIGGRHPASAWIGYERYDSPARVWFQDILARGVAAVSSGPRASGVSPVPSLTEQQVNQIVGVIAVGLFAARGANVCLLGMADGVQTLKF